MAVKRSVVISIAIALTAVIAAVFVLAACLNRYHGPLPPPGVSEDLLPKGVEKFQKLDDVVYRGAQPDARGFRELEKLGIRTVIDLRKHHSDEKLLVGTSLGLKNIGMNVWHEEDKDVMEFLKTVKDRSRAPFFVHCKQGVDRAGFMCAIYRIVAQGWDKDKAIAEMRAFGSHRIWKNLERYIQKMDVDATRKTVGF
jgi:tyrosine-protein phosphatase SIW14